MSNSKDNLSNKIDEINIEIPDLFAIEEKMFYHRFKTSNELCSLGLFSFESEMSTKKHRKMKCNFCHSVLSGWKDKFCKHLDKCERAQAYFAEHPVNTEYDLLQRKSKREQSNRAITPAPKRLNIQGDLFSLEYDDYLSYLAVGFVSSTGVSKNIFDNDFLKNLCFSLHWQPPSMYLLQKKVVEFGSLLRTKIDSFLSSQSSVGLIVYPWMDINKRFTLSYLACCPSGLLVYLFTSTCSQDSWGNVYVYQQIHNMIKQLEGKGIHVSTVYYDEYSTYEDCRAFFLQEPSLKSVCVFGNTLDWCKNALSMIFSHTTLLGFKQYIITLYQVLSKPSAIQEEFFRHCTVLKEFPSTPLDEDNWPFLFTIMKHILDDIQAVSATLSICNENGLLTNHPLSHFQITSEWTSSLQAIYDCLNELAQSCQAKDLTLNRLVAYSLVSSTLEKVHMNQHLPEDSGKFIESVLEERLKSYFDEDLVCLDYFLTSPRTIQNVFFDRKDLEKAIHRCCREPEVALNCIKEVEPFLKDIHMDLSWEAVVEFWNQDGKSLYPNLAKLVGCCTSYPSVQEITSIYSNIKTYIHLHVRSKKDGEKDGLKNNDEMMISCNRHLVIRWNLDFQ